MNETEKYEEKNETKWEKLRKKKKNECVRTNEMRDTIKKRRKVGEIKYAEE